MYSRGNAIQYPVIKHNEKEYRKECVNIEKNVCVYIYIYIFTHIYNWIYTYI